MGWAIANNVTLLASGIHDLAQGSSGSGIYQGGLKILDFTYRENGSKLVKSKLKAAKQKEGSELKRVKLDSFYLFEDLTKYSKIELKPGSNHVSLNYGDFACEIHYEAKNHEHFHALIYNGNRTFAAGKFSAQIQVCGIAPKELNSSQNVEFRRLKVSGRFSQHSIPMPVSLDENLLPFFDFEYTKSKENLATMELKTTHNLFSFALYARKMK